MKWAAHLTIFWVIADLVIENTTADIQDRAARAHDEATRTRECLEAEQFRIACWTGEQRVRLSVYLPINPTFQLIQQNGIFHVSHTIETIITELGLHEDQLHKLQDELATFWSENPDKVTSWYALRELPYLTACIHEGLRLGAGSMKRSPREFPDDEIEYKGWVVPRGVSEALIRDLSGRPNQI